MRHGVNPQKLNPQLEDYPLHQIIIPVYIPNFEGYFQNSLEVLDLCLQSLQLSIYGHNIGITVISNGSADEAVFSLKSYLDRGWITQLIINEKNRGKIDSIIAAARGSFAKLITFADADVFFKPGWLEATYDIFSTFPECGQVSPFPAPSMIEQAPSTVLGAVLRRNLKLRGVVTQEDFDQIIGMLGVKKDPNHTYRDAQYIVERGACVACVGCDHFITTVYRDVLRAIPGQPSLKAIVGNSEFLYIDLPPEKLSMWKLSTPKLLVYHIGNTPEDWMRDDIRKYEGVEKQPPENLLLIQAVRLRTVVWVLRWIPFRIRSKLGRMIRKVLYSK
jgi:hypothetical protein